MAMEHREEVLQSPASQRLREFLRARQEVWQQGVPEFEQFERELHEQIMNLERECVARRTGPLQRDRRADRSGGRELPARLAGDGDLPVERGAGAGGAALVPASGAETKSICPLELRAGLISGYWTPRAARQGAFVLAQLPASQAEALFSELGAMQPSRSTLDRLPRTLSVHWEGHRQEWEAAVQAQETVPPRGGDPGHLGRWRDGPA